MALVMAAWVAGCTTTTTPQEVQPVARPPSPFMSFVATAPVGSSQTVPSQTNQGLVRVTVVEAYAAASGRLCKRLAIADPTTGPSERIACRDGSAWTLVPPLRAAPDALGPRSL